MNYSSPPPALFFSLLSFVAKSSYLNSMPVHGKQHSCGSSVRDYHQSLVNLTELLIFLVCVHFASCCARGETEIFVPIELVCNIFLANT